MSQNLGKIIKDFKESKLEEERNLEIRMHREEMEHHELEKKKMHLLGRKIIPAKLSDYTRWLKGFLEKGGKPTHYYDGPFKNAGFGIALKDFELIPLAGSQAVDIIVPAHIKFLGGNLGHSNLYFERDYSNSGGWVPIYNDVKLEE